MNTKYSSPDVRKSSTDVIIESTVQIAYMYKIPSCQRNSPANIS